MGSGLAVHVWVKGGAKRGVGWLRAMEWVGALETGVVSGFLFFSFLFFLQIIGQVVEDACSLQEVGIEEYGNGLVCCEVSSL